MPFRLEKSTQFGFLGSAITAGQTTIPLRPGHINRFDTLAAGEYQWGVIVDENEDETSYNRFEFFKRTGQSGDNLVAVRGQHNTTAKAFPITGGNSPTRVRVAVSDNLLNLLAMIDGAGAIIQASAPTLTAFSPRNIILNPSTPITVTLPTTDVWAAKEFRFVNLGTAAITINSSGGGQVATLPAGTNLAVYALQDAPTAASHWGIPATFFPDGSYLFAAGTGGATHRGSGILRDTSGNSLVQSADVTLAGSGGPTSGALNALTVPADTLSRDNSVLHFKGWGTKANANAALSLQPRWGSGGALTTHTFAANVTNWVLQTLILRTGAGAQDWVSWITLNRDDTASTTLVGSGTASEDETANLVFDLFCSSKHTNDVVVGAALIPVFMG